MTVWYRAHQSAKKAEVFSGVGGLHCAGRWHHAGTKVVYCSASIALCTLEWLSHHGLSVSGFDYYRYSIQVPAHLITTLSLTKLPGKWQATPPTEITRELANKHLFSSNKYLAMAVPSVVVPEEYNLVLNPLHTDYKTVMKTVRNLGKYHAPVRSSIRN